MKYILTTAVFCIPFTLGLFFCSSFLYKKVHWMLFNPLLLSMLILIFLVLEFQVPYGEYAQASSMIDFLLGPSVVSLGYLLYRQSAMLRGRLLSVLSSILIGSLVGIVSAGGIISLMGGNHQLVASMFPKSVTTPIAISLSQQAGGIPALTAVVVVITGIFGGTVSPFIFKLFRITNPVAQGIALGSSSHGMGTAVALQKGELQGAMSGMAIGIMGFFTALLIPLINYLWTIPLK